MCFIHSDKFWRRVDRGATIATIFGLFIAAWSFYASSKNNTEAAALEAERTLREFERELILILSETELLLYRTPNSQLSSPDEAELLVRQLESNIALIDNLFVVMESFSSASVSLSNAWASERASYCKRLSAASMFKVSFSDVFASGADKICNPSKY